MRKLKTLSCLLLFIHCQAAWSAEIHDAARAGDLQSLGLLIESGSDVNAIDYVQGSPLHIAAVKGHSAVVEFLLRYNADHGAQEFGKGDTPLHWAALGGSPDVINLLLAAGADIDAENDIQNTPLHIASEAGNADAALLLIENGADVRAENLKGKAALHLAGLAGANDVVDALINKGAQYALTEFVSPLLKSADIQNGEKYWEMKCRVCHSIDRGIKRDTGPPLRDVVGREMASLPDFEYSEAFKRADDVWDYENLNALLLDGWNFWPGNNMGGGEYGKISIPSIETRADIIAYLRAQSASPVPLPE